MWKEGMGSGWRRRLSDLNGFLQIQMDDLLIAAWRIALFRASISSDSSRNAWIAWIYVIVCHNLLISLQIIANIFLLVKGWHLPVR